MRGYRGDLVEIGSSLAKVAPTSMSGGDIGRCWSNSAELGRCCANFGQLWSALVGPNSNDIGQNHADLKPLRNLVKVRQSLLKFGRKLSIARLTRPTVVNVLQPEVPRDWLPQYSKPKMSLGLTWPSAFIMSDELLHLDITRS